MSKIILAVIIVVVLIILLLGLYLILAQTGSDGANQNTNVQNNQNNNPAMFEIKGMKIEILQEGSGEAAKTGDSVTVHYMGTLEDGTIFDSSIDRGEPFPFTLGGRVIQGWNEGVVGMKVGEKRKLVIPSEMAYGPNGYPPVIPKNATLTFEIEVLKIN